MFSRFGQSTNFINPQLHMNQTKQRIQTALSPQIEQQKQSDGSFKVSVLKRQQTDFTSATANNQADFLLTRSDTVPKSVIKTVCVIKIPLITSFVLE